MNTQTNTEEKINLALNEIRPFLQADGGDIELVEVQGDKVMIRLLGACNQCSINQMTLKSGVEMTIKQYVPTIQEVINVD